MSSFQDREGRTWTIDMNLDSVDELKKRTERDGQEGVSIYELANEKARPLSELLGCPPRLAEVCYILAGVDVAGVSERDFAKAIKGPQFAAMADAFLEELVLFFQGARQEHLRTILAGSKALETKTIGKLNRIDLDKLADKLLTQATAGASELPMKDS